MADFLKELAARYLAEQLQEAGFDGVMEIDSGTRGESRTETIRRFSPYYNSSSSAALRAKGLDEVRVLISTDVLAEGLNLQDARRLINYDLHWNPVRLTPTWPSTWRPCPARSLAARPTRCPACAASSSATPCPRR